MSEAPTRAKRERWFRIAAFATALVLLSTWLAYTPPGLLGKADAIGYAVCHRIAVRSFFIGERQIPLCARCSGMYLGALLGLVYLLPRGHRGGMPSLKISLALGAFFLAFGIDGVNSYLHFFPKAPSLYQPQNYLRLFTGTGLGLGMAAVLLPVFHQSAWKDWSGEPALRTWRQFAVLLGLAVLLDLAILWQNPLILYPLALLSSATVLVILTLVYSIVWLLILKNENTYHTWGELAGVLAAGFTIALLQIGIMDLVRFFLTGTWNGFFSGG